MNKTTDLTGHLVVQTHALDAAIQVAQQRNITYTVQAPDGTTRTIHFYITSAYSKLADPRGIVTLDLTAIDLADVDISHHLPRATPPT